MRITNEPGEPQIDYELLLRQNFSKIENQSEVMPSIFQLAFDLGVILDIRFLALAFHLKPLKTGCFSREEFIYKLLLFGIDSTQKLLEILAGLDEFCRNNMDHIYLYTFNLFKENENQKLIELRIALHIICILVPHLPHTQLFVNYMQSQNSYRGINFDQWQMFYMFDKTVSQDLSEYDINDAWPVMVDDFVAFCFDKGIVQTKFINDREFKESFTIEQRDECEDFGMDTS